MSALHTRQAGRTPAARAFTVVRVLSAVVLVLLGLGVGSVGEAGSSGPGRAVVLLGSAAALLGTDGLLAVALRTRGARHGRIALVGTGVDAAVVLAVLWVAGPPPGSPAVVLLLLPLLGAALSGGLAALAVTWVGCAVLLAAQQFLAPGGLDVDGLRASAVVLPLLLLVALPIAVLGEHLVSAVARVQAAEAEARVRTRLLTTAVAAGADLARPDGTGVLTALVAGAVSLGATSARVTAADGIVLAGAGDAAGLVRELTDAVDGPRLTFSVEPGGPGGLVVEAIDLIVAQARVAHARARQLEGVPTDRVPLEPRTPELVSAP